MVTKSDFQYKQYLSHKTRKCYSSITIWGRGCGEKTFIEWQQMFYLGLSGKHQTLSYLIQPGRWRWQNLPSLCNNATHCATQSNSLLPAPGKSMLLRQGVTGHWGHLSMTNAAAPLHMHQYVKTWWHPQNQKCIVVRGGLSNATDKMYKQFSEIWACVFWDVQANRQTDRQTCYDAIPTLCLLAMGKVTNQCRSVKWTVKCGTT